MLEATDDSRLRFLAEVSAVMIGSLDTQESVAELMDLSSRGCATGPPSRSSATTGSRGPGTGPPRPALLADLDTYLLKRTRRDMDGWQDMRMGSLRQWRTAGSRPLSARGHLIGMVFWLVLAAPVAHQLLTEDEGPGLVLLLLAVVSSNVVVLLVSYRNTLRRGERRASVDGDPPGGTS